MTFPHDRETVDGALAAFRKALRERAGAEGELTAGQIGAAFIDAHPDGAGMIAEGQVEDSKPTGEGLQAKIERAKEADRAKAEKESTAATVRHFYL